MMGKSQPLRVLIVEDNPSDAELVVRELHRGGLSLVWSRVETEPAFLSALEEKPDIILSDFSMPVFSGLRALELLRASGLDIPLILVSGTVGEDVAVEAMKSGAADYLIKDRLARLVSAVERALKERQLARQNRLAGELNRRLMVAIDQAAESIMFTDAHGTILYVNQGFENMTGYSRREVLGHTPRLLKSDRHPPEFFRDLWQAIARGEVWQGQFTNKRKDGALYEEEATISPIRGSDGRIDSFVAVKRDITRERLLERQVIEAQKMEVVGQLAGGVAHDYNNILAANILRLNMLLAEPGLSEELRTELEELCKGEERAARLTRQLLVFSRRQVMQMQPVELTAVLEEEIKMFRRLLGAHIELSVRPQNGNVWILADSGMIEQVIMNLCINARDAMPNGGRLSLGVERVELDPAAAAHVEARPGTFARLTVADTGCGISPEILPRIFEPFFTTKEVGKGTGLGLSTVYGIVKQHHGWIEVRSEVGKGSEFQVFLPLIPGQSAVATAVKSSTLKRGDETILVVEDEEALRVSMVKCLESAGYQVFASPNAVEAIQSWSHRIGQIDLLLTDVILPGGINGLELADAFKKMNPSLSVLFASGHSNVLAEQSHSVETGRAFLPKPFDPDVLTGAVRNALDQ